MYNINLNKIIKIFVIVIIVLIIILLSRGCNRTAKLELIGDSEITIFQNSSFIDPGYTILETSDSDSFYVNTNSNLNINKVGIYQIEYTLYNSNNKYISSTTRKVTVLEDKLSNISMYLKGNDEEYFFVDDYVDYGIEVYNGNVDVTSEVNIVSNVNPSEVGKYEVKYQIYNNSNLKETIRKVNIVDYDIEEDIDEVGLVINLTIECEDYYYTLLPDGTKEYSKYVSYTYTDTGEQEFDIYLKSGSHKKYIANIDNIDKSGPMGTCSVYYDNNKTTITVNATDSLGISKYSYNGLDFYGNTTVINKIATNVVIRAYDKRNNYSEIKCKAYYGTGFRNIGVYSDGHVTGKSGYITCGTSVLRESLELDELMKSYGYRTREAVAAAGAYLATYKYEIPYFWGGKYVKKGFNPQWGCSERVYGKVVCTKQTGSDSCELGLDCTGLVSWAFAQAGFDYSTIRQDSITEGNWGNFNARVHRYDFNANNIYFANQIKPGDIVHREGHVGLVIGVDTNRIQIVEMLGPIFVSTVDKTTGRGLSKQKGFTDFVLMNEFYTMYGN